MEEALAPARARRRRRLSSSGARLLPLIAAVTTLSLAPGEPADAAPAARPPSAGQLRLQVETLRVLGRVLYVAAHPDDENTHVLSWLVNGRGMRTAYLSMTRGGGGQNLIGAERAEMAALLRTQELLAARAIDGAEQRFTRARDFGYSKSAKETLRVWGEPPSGGSSGGGGGGAARLTAKHHPVLADIVRVLRTFRPDVIVTRFAGDGSGRHGHHTASAQLAVRAFELAADPKAFPEQIKQGLSPWAATRVVWNTYSWRRVAAAKLRGALAVDIGGYSALLGQSFGEIAARSRTMHKSQGFGRSGTRGKHVERFKHLAGKRARRDLLDDVETRWRRVKGGAQLEKLLAHAVRGLDPMAPERAIPRLVQAALAMQRLGDHRDKAAKLADIAQAIADCAGLYVEARARAPLVVAGGKLAIDASLIAQRGGGLTLERVRFPDGHVARARRGLAAGGTIKLRHSMTVPRSAQPSQPYWLEQRPGAGLYNVADPKLAGAAQRPAPFEVELTLRAGAFRFTLRRPVIYRFTDRVRGERRRLVQVAPAAMVTPSAPVLMLPGRRAQTLEVRVRAGRARVAGHVTLELPAGFRATPARAAFKLGKVGSEVSLRFSVRPPDPRTAAGRAAAARAASGAGLAARVVAEVGKRRYARGFAQIDYAHVPTQTVFPLAEVKLVPLSLRTRNRRVGYVMGAGDDVAKSLARVGYRVTQLRPDELDAKRLARFDAVVLGVRAYNTHKKALSNRNAELWRFVRRGGTLIVQYNTNSRWRPLRAQVGPYPLTIGRGRITDQTAALAPIGRRHRALTQPNRLGPADFTGWVQERGLYFAKTWDKRYRAVLRGADPGARKEDGALLVSRYGRGAFVYTGLAFFRQLPAGVPGAYRLLANLLAL